MGYAASRFFVLTLLASHLAQASPTRELTQVVLTPNGAVYAAASPSATSAGSMIGKVDSGRVVRSEAKRKPQKMATSLTSQELSPKPEEAHHSNTQEAPGSIDRELIASHEAWDWPELKMPKGFDRPTRGPPASCIVPQWSPNEYVCSEAQSVAALTGAPQNHSQTGAPAAAQSTGNASAAALSQAPRLMEGQACTVTCPGGKWWMAPNVERMTCNSWGDWDGSPPGGVDCEMQSSIYVVGFLLPLSGLLAAYYYFSIHLPEQAKAAKRQAAREAREAAAPRYDPSAPAPWEDAQRGETPSYEYGSPGYDMRPASLNPNAPQESPVPQQASQAHAMGSAGGT